IPYQMCGPSRNHTAMDAARGALPILRTRSEQEVRSPGNPAGIASAADEAVPGRAYPAPTRPIIEDALHREESCGAHFREEYQTEDGEALRNDEDFKYVSAWEYKGNNQYQLHKEHLNFEYVELKQRSYK